MIFSFSFKEKKKNRFLILQLKERGVLCCFHALFLSQKKTMTTVLRVDSCSLKCAVACTTVLYTKWVVTAFKEGKLKGKNGARAPEDHLIPGSPEQNFKGQQSDKAKDELSRWARITANDLENIPFGLIIIWASCLANVPSKVLVGAASTFTLARIGHTLSYANGALVPRILCHLSAQGALFTLLYHSVKQVCF